MAIDPHDDVVAGCGDGGVECRRRAPCGIGHGDHARISLGQPGRDRVGAVSRGTEREDHLEGAGVGRREDRLDCLDQMRLLVKHGHDDGDSRSRARRISHVGKGSLRP